MLLLSWIITVVAAFWLGYKLNKMQEYVKFWVGLIMDATKRGLNEDEPTGSVIEPDEDDPVAQARRDFEAIQRKLNDK